MASLKYTKGMPNSYLKTTVKKVDGSSALISQASKSASSAKKDPASASAAQKDLLLAIHQMVEDSKTQSLDLNARTCDVILDKISQWLEQVNENLTSDEDIEKVKEAIIDEINSASFSKILSAVLVSQVTSLFDDSAKREDIEELKGYIAGLVKEGGGSEGSDGGSEQSGTTYSSKEVSSTADEESGDYRDSTVAANFSTLQQFVESQVNMLNENIKSIPGGIGFGKIGKLLGAGFTGVLSATKKLGSKIGSLAKGTFSKLASVTKIIGGGILKGIGKTLSGIAGGVASIGKGIGKLGSGIFKGFGKIGSTVKGFGAKVGGAIAHPFKAIGGFFKNRKKDKAEAKKEKLREKFMNFMMKAFEKLWDFLEPILSKLKIFMLIALVPILTTAATVIAIIAGLVAIVAGAWILWNIIKKKALQFWNYIVSGEMLDDIIAGLKKAWDWLCDFGKWLWDLTIDALKYIFVDVWVDLGKWLWKKLCEFGNWLYNKWIYPYIVQPINDHIIKPLRELWENKIKPIVQPFIDSLTNLKNRLVSIWQKFQWDENKSFFENLKCLASIVKDAVLDWWNTSPFKTFYETYLDPIIKSVQDLIQRIKNIWNNFNWDENKSFLENLKAFWDECWSAIKSWWEGSTIKKYWDMLTDWLSNIWQKVKDWWNGTSIGKWINSLQQKIENLKQKLSKVFVHIPGWGGGKNIYPFAPAVGKPFIIDAKDDKEAMAKKRDEEIADLKQKIASGKKRNWLTGTNYEKELARLEAQKKAEQQESLAQQQVQNAMQPVNNINNMNSNTNVELQKAGEEMSTKAAAAEQATQDYRQQQSIIGSQSLAELHDMREEMRKGFKDPAVVPMPIPYGPQRNAAMMEHY